MPSPPHILVIRFSSLGDVVIASAVLKTLAHAIPDAQLTLATKATYQPLFENFEADLRVAPYHTGQSLLSYRGQLSRVRYDHIIDLHGSIRSVLLGRMLRAKHRARISKHTAERRAMVRSKMGLERPLSALRSYLEILPQLGINIAESYPGLFLSLVEKDRVNQLRAEYSSCLGIGWGAHWPTKIVPPDVWNGLLTRLRDKKPMRLRLFGLESDRPAMAAFQRDGKAKHPQIEMTIECGDPLREVMIKLASCDVFVSSDSGLMHLAAAMGVPSFGLFGPTHPALGFAPAGPGARAFHAGTYCSPCHRHGAAPCFRENRFCFDELNLDEIAAAIEAVVATTTPPIESDRHA